MLFVVEHYILFFTSEHAGINHHTLGVTPRIYLYNIDIAYYIQFVEREKEEKKKRIL